MIENNTETAQIGRGGGTSATMQQLPEQKATTIKWDFTNFYQAALSYLERRVTSWTTTVRRRARAQYFVTLPLQQEVTERRATVVENWSILLKAQRQKI